MATDHGLERATSEPVGGTRAGDLAVPRIVPDGAADDAGPLVETEIADPARSQPVERFLPGRAPDVVVVGDDGESTDEAESTDPATRRPGPLGQAHRPRAGAGNQGTPCPGLLDRGQRRTACQDPGHEAGITAGQADEAGVRKPLDSRRIYRAC